MTADLMIDCRQCGRAEATQVLRRDRHGVRYRCLHCGALVRTTDLATLRPRTEPGSALVVPEPTGDPLLEFMPADMAAWVRRGSRHEPTAAGLTKAVVYQHYSQWDRQHPDADLPAFSGIVGLLHARCYRLDRVLPELTERHPDHPDQVRLRVQHARRWLAVCARDRCWVLSRLGQDGDLLAPDPEAVRPLLEPLARDGELDQTGGHTARAALFGTDGGPTMRQILVAYEPAEVLDALRAYVADGSRPLRTDVLAHLEAPLVDPAQQSAGLAR